MPSEPPPHLQSGDVYTVNSTPQFSANQHFCEDFRIEADVRKVFSFVTTAGVQPGSEFTLDT